MTLFDAVRLAGLLSCTLGSGVAAGVVIASAFDLRDLRRADRPAATPERRA